MGEERTPRPPGAFRRALFQDVPYILDSLWRWGEFRVNRLGTVQFEDPHHYVLRPAWLCGAFVLFALMCLFAVFGPTWDALCSLRGFGFATEIRNIASLLMMLVAIVLFMRLLNAITFHLTRRAEILGSLRPAQDNANESPFPQPPAAQPAMERRLRRIRVLFDRRAEEHIGNLSRFFRALPRLPRTDAS